MNMMMKIILILFCLNEVLYGTKVLSPCGHPGLPFGAKFEHEEDDRKYFDDGDTVRYICPSHLFTYDQTRKCVSGRWTWDQAKCGYK